MPISMSDAEFGELVDRAIDSLPPEIARGVQNIVVLVEPYDEQDPTLLGIYDGVALTERPANHAGMLPDRILIFREPLLEMCESHDEVVREVQITVVHEVAHHFGIDDQRLHELGYA